MTLLLTAWAIIGLAHWIDWMVRYSEGRLLLLDLAVGLPAFVILGPLVTIRKLLN
jgi:hypothetical protein